MYSLIMYSSTLFVRRSYHLVGTVTPPELPRLKLPLRKQGTRLLPINLIPPVWLPVAVQIEFQSLVRCTTYSMMMTSDVKMTSGQLWTTFQIRIYAKRTPHYRSVSL